MSDKTTIQVRRDTKNRLETMKQGSESLDETLRRELGMTPQETESIVDKLVRYLSQENKSEIYEMLEVLRSEFEFEYGFDETPSSVADFALSLKHPETEAPVFIFESSENDNYSAMYRGTDGMETLIDWGRYNKLSSGSWSGVGDEEREELLRISRGAYATAEER